MLKKILLPLIVAFGLLNVYAIADEVKTVALNDVIDNGVEYVGQKIKIEGTVDHICKHSSKKLNLFGDTPDKSIDVFAGKGISQFSPDLIGNNLIVTGTIKEDRLEKSRVLDYIAKLEKDKKSNKDKEIEHEGECKSEQSPADKKLHDSKYKENMDYANGLLEQMKESGKDYSVSYSFICEKFEIKK